MSEENMIGPGPTNYGEDCAVCYQSVKDCVCNPKEKPIKAIEQTHVKDPPAFEAWKKWFNSNEGWRVEGSIQSFLAGRRSVPSAQPNITTIVRNVVLNLSGDSSQLTREQLRHKVDISHILLGAALQEYDEKLEQQAAVGDSNEGETE